MITKNMDLEVTIVDLGINGEGIAKHEGAVIFVPFALVGEIVKIHIIYAKSKFFVGKITEIIQSSPYRVKPLCPNFTRCGGCDLQHLSNEKILDFKTHLVANDLSDIGHIDVTDKVRPCIGLNEYHYRNKFSFPIGYKNNAGFVGMYKENSHDIIPITDCFIQVPWAKPIIDSFNDFLSKGYNTIYNEANHTGLIKHLVCRMEDDQLLVCVVINGDKLNHYQELVDGISKHFKHFGLMVNINKLHNNVILTDKYNYLYGLKTIKLNVNDIKFEISLNSFMQVNTPIANAIYTQAQDLISGKMIVNAFSGAGLLSAYLAKTAKKVYGIEIVESSHINAENLRINNHIDNLTNILGDVSIELPKISDFDSIVLDPPRKGCAKPVLDTILQVVPNNIVYISCDPATLSRDIGILKEKYDLVFAQPYDMFPKTRHVETLAYLTKKE